MTSSEPENAATAIEVFLEDTRVASRQPIRRRPCISAREFERRDLKALMEDANADRGANTWSPATVRLYVGALGLIRETVYAHRDPPEQGKHVWIGKAAKVIAKVEKEYEELETRKLAVQALLAAARQLFKQTRKSIYREAADVYTEKVTDIAFLLKERRQSQGMSAREQLNFLAWEEITKHVDNYCRRWSQLNKQKDPFSGSQLRTLQDMLLVTCYTAIDPLRNEWASVKVRNFDPAVDNFVRFSGDQPPEVTFNRYKTWKKYGPQVFRLPEPLSSMARRWRSDTNSDYLFVKVTGQPYNTASWAQQVGRVFAKITEGYALTSQLLRKSFCTWQQASLPTTAQLIPIAASARRMGHSLDIHQSYRRVAGDRDELIANVRKVKAESGISEATGSSRRESSRKVVLSE